MAGPGNNENKDSNSMTDVAASTDDKSKAEQEQKQKDEAAAKAKQQAKKNLQIDKVIMHPLVLLSIVDHYTRCAKDTSRRVIGILLGETHGTKVDCTNSYAIPFEEDASDNAAWYIDRQYHEDMYAMFRKINAAERVVGWYSTSRTMKRVDLQISAMMQSYCEQPVLVRVNIDANAPLNAGTSSSGVASAAERELELPTQAYIALPQLDTPSLSSGAAAPENPTRTVFQHIPSEIGAYEAEEVGVEHLLRNLRDATDAASLTDAVQAKLHSLRALQSRLSQVDTYLTRVSQGVLPLNHTVLHQLQDMCNLVPDLTDPALRAAFAESTCDNYAVIYTASLVRSITALHDLIGNKLSNKAIEADEGKSKQQIEEEKAARLDKAKAAKKEEQDKANHVNAKKKPSD